MAFGKGESSVSPKIAEDRNLHTALNRLADDLGMARAVGAVENYAGEIDTRVKGSETGDYGGGGPSHPAHIQDDDDRRVGQTGHVGCAAVVALTGVAIIKTHNPFDDSDVGAGGVFGQEGGDVLRWNEPRVNVCAGMTGGEGVVGG